MTTIYDGGPANPIGNESGISIRDYFATAIMTGVYSAGAQTTITAEDAYKAADLMLVARTADIYAEPAPVLISPPPPTPAVVEESVAEVPADTPVEPAV